MIKWVVFGMVIGGLWACEKTIQVQPEQQPAKLVIEAQVESGQAPIVILSNSLNYFSEIDLFELDHSYIHGAKVTVNNGTASYVLTEDSIPLSNGYSFYYYSIAQNILSGEFGKKYTLTVETGGQAYHSSTNIPLLTKKIDSIWWKKAPSNVDTSKVLVMSRVTDPPGLGNYIRYYTSTNGKDFLPGLNSVYDDQIVDGKTYDIQIDRGVSKNESLKRDEYGFFNRGDTVIVKLCNIDKATYDFWRTWEFTFQSVGNPFSSPGKVMGNISNGALGSFCGYAVQYKQLIIPK